MMEKTVNRPLANTFRWLGMGEKHIELPAEPERISLGLKSHEKKTTLLEGSSAYTLFEAELEEGASLDLIQICGKDAFERSFTDIEVNCGKNASFHWYRIVAEEKEVYDNCSVRLNGDGSFFSADIGYRLDGDESYDINCEAIHTGRSTESAIKASGVLADRSSKLMRSTIDFRTGSSASVGNESEDVLLMDETVRNKSLPVILCSEEDVVGNHGASIGRPDEKVLYYMESRGIDKDSAYELLAGAKLLSVIEKIPDKEIKQRLLAKYADRLCE